MKPYQTVTIVECHESLQDIPQGILTTKPHPYQVLGAPYGQASPFCLRQGVLNALLRAQEELQKQYPHLHLKVFDAYRPIAVQQFMVDYTFNQQLKHRGWLAPEISPIQKAEVMTEVLKFWAIPSDDPATPPPHSTGAAIDLTIANYYGQELDMGSPIDEISERSYPDYFRHSVTNLQAHNHRNLLKTVLVNQGFVQHPHEWWHFSLGDQLWAWQSGASQARYGAI
ncbi:MAG: M15 family metallopeptidase [Pseudanabaena sp. ELA607]